MRLPHNNVNEATSQKGECLKIMWMPHNNVADSQKLGCCTTIELPHNNENGLFGFLHCLAVAAANYMQKAFDCPIRVIVHFKSKSFHVRI